MQMSLSTVSFAQELLSYLPSNVDIMLFLISIAVHAVVFGKYKPFARSAKGQKAAKVSLPSPRREAVEGGSSPRDGRDEAKLLRTTISEAGLEAALQAFEQLAAKTPATYTALIEGCASRAEASRAEELLHQAIAAGMLEPMAVKLLAKLYIGRGDAAAVHALLASLASVAGLAPSAALFAELLECAVRENHKVVPSLLDQMEKYQVTPSAHICVQAFRGAQKSGKVPHFERAVQVMAQCEANTEAVLSSCCDAGIQLGCQAQLATQLRRHWATGKVAVKNAYSFASIIRAYGFVSDTQGALRTWQEMTRCRVTPVRVTLGCMVEALAANSCTDQAHRLIQDCMADEELKPLVNVVIYCSVLKGYSHEKCFDRVWQVYAEIQAAELQCTIITFNTLIDACSRSKDMARIPALLEAMSQANIAPNTITFSTIIKAYCAGPENRLSQAFDVLEQMKHSPDVSPDEVTYNTMLDGCARFGQFDRGMSVLEEMQQQGVKPSNFTLSVLAKLANRSRRPQEAFQLTSDIAVKYNIRMNVHVYNNLIQACNLSTDLPRALETFAGLLEAKVRPDARTYSLLLQGAIAARSPSDAAGLLRAAGGLPGAHATAAPHRDLAQPRGGLSADVVCDTLEGIAARRGEEQLIANLLREVRGARGLPVDARRLMRSAYKVLH